MDLLEYFNKTVKGEKIPVDEVNPNKVSEQISELLSYIAENDQVQKLYIIEATEVALEKLCKNLDVVVATSAAYSLMNKRLPGFMLSKYV